MPWQDKDKQKEYMKEYRKTYDKVEENKNRRNNLRKDRRHSNKEKERNLRRKYSLKRIYGINQQDYEKLLKDQNFCCAICGSFDPKGNKHSEHFQIDHDHSNGMIRGLLCCKCNRGLGLFGDSAEFIQKALSYLQRESKLEPFIWHF